MTERQRPTLADQIQAVEWAEEHVRALRLAKSIDDSVTLLDEVRISAKLERSLEHAAETLRTLEFGEGGREVNDVVINRIAQAAADQVRYQLTANITWVAANAESPIEQWLAAAVDAYVRFWPCEFALRHGSDLKEVEDNKIAEDGVIFCCPQLQIGKYRVDFGFCVREYRELSKTHWLVVECDGHDFHERTKEQAANDRARDRDLQAKGYTVFRFTGSELWKNPIGCAEQIYHWAQAKAFP